MLEGGVEVPLEYEVCPANPPCPLQLSTITSPAHQSMHAYPEHARMQPTCSMPLSLLDCSGLCWGHGMSFLIAFSLLSLALQVWASVWGLGALLGCWALVAHKYCAADCASKAENTFCPLVPAG